MSISPATTPEPLPQEHPDGIPVWPTLIRVLSDPGQEMRQAFSVSPEVKAHYDRWLADMQARHQEGVRKYGAALKTHNGRSALVDAYQESLDLIVYLMQADLEGNVQSVAEHLAAQLGPDGPRMSAAAQRANALNTPRQISLLLSLMVYAERDMQTAPKEMRPDAA